MIIDYFFGFACFFFLFFFVFFISNIQICLLIYNNYNNFQFLMIQIEHKLYSFIISIVVFNKLIQFKIIIKKKKRLLLIFQMLIKSSSILTKAHKFILSLHYPSSKFVLNLDLYGKRQSNLYQHTYLQSNFHIIDRVRHDKYRDDQISRYINLLKEHKQEILEIKENNIDVESLENNKVFRYIKEQFNSLKEKLKGWCWIILQMIQDQNFERDECVQKILLLADLTQFLNILEITLWNKILMSAMYVYKYMTIYQKNKFMAIFKKYMLKFNFINEDIQKKGPLIFLTRQSLNRDLIDVKFFLTMIEDQTIFSSQKHDSKLFNFQLSLLLKKIFIILKFSKSQDLDFRYLRIIYQKYQNQILQNLYRISYSQLLEIHRFYSRLNIQKDFYFKIEKSLTQKFVQTQFSSSRQFYLCVNHVKIWNKGFSYSEEMFKQHIQPIIYEQLRQSKELQIVQHFNIWKYLAFDLLLLPNRNDDLIISILDLLKRNKVPEDRTIHLINHYYHFKKLYEQNKVTVTEDMFNTCENYEKQPIDFNKVESFWFKIISQIFHEKNVFKSMRICIFQIDILVYYNNSFYAFQIIGQHYTDKNNIQVEKKTIKTQIMKFLGIKTINVHCNQDVPKLVMRFKNSEKAKNFIIQKMKQIQQNI